jgi:hypothetical protein
VFASCSRLRSIRIPSSVQRISEGSFRGCKSLSTVTFEGDSQLSYLDRMAFDECPSLSSICIPPSLQIFFALYAPLVTIIWEARDCDELGMDDSD